MDVLTEEELRVAPGRRKAWPFSQPALYAAGLSYAVLVACAVVHHEPWADEAQSWLLARDANLFDLWTRLLHYEGTTGLWQTLLHILIGLGLPYSGMNVFSALCGLAGTCILLWRSPFPWLIRMVLPFTFFLCYQYAVIARSYTLLPLLLFCCAALYAKAQDRPRLFTALLCLMAAVSIHGMVLASAIGLSALAGCRDRKRAAWFAAFFAAVLILLAATASPARDGTFIHTLNFSLSHFLEVSAKAFATAFTGEWISSLVLVGLSIPLLWRGGGWLFFVLAATLLCSLASAVYAQVWHHGFLFLAWLVSLWISLPGGGRRPYQLAVASLGMVAAAQCYWTLNSIRYDWQYAYSGSLATAEVIRQADLRGNNVYAIGYACTAIQPYFESNIFANVNEGRPEAYWDWSTRNHVNLDSQHLAALKPTYVIVGYKNEFERGIWTGLVRKSGYQAIRHFEGNTYWQTHILEPESYDLYRRSAAP
jgi:hypothetical protein